MGKYQEVKEKKVDKEKDESVEVTSGSEGEPSEKASKQEYARLKKEVIRLKESFRKLKKSVKNDLSEIKNNLKWLFKKLGHKYSTQQVSSPSSSSDTSFTLSSDDVTNKAHKIVQDKGKSPIDLTENISTAVDPLGKGRKQMSRKPMTRSSSTKPFPSTQSLLVLFIGLYFNLIHLLLFISHFIKFLMQCCPLCYTNTSHMLSPSFFC